MEYRFVSGPLHNQIIDVGDDPPPAWIAPSVPRDRYSNEPQFRPITNSWDDLSAPNRLDLHEYGRRGDTYVWKVTHRADDSGSS